MAYAGFRIVKGIVPSELRIDMTVSKAGIATKRRASELLQRRAVEWAIDGPMWEGGGRPGALYRDTVNGVEFNGVWSNTHGATLSVVDGVASTTPGQSPKPNATFALQGYPELLRGGNSVVDTSLNRNHRWRVGIGIERTGTLCFAIGWGNMELFAAEIAKHEVSDAIYTDGGGSASLVGPDGSRYGDPENRAVASWIYVPKRVQSAPVSGGGAGLLFTALLGLGTYYLLR